MPRPTTEFFEQEEKESQAILMQQEEKIEETKKAKIAFNTVSEAMQKVEKLIQNLQQEKEESTKRYISLNTKLQEAEQFYNVLADNLNAINDTTKKSIKESIATATSDFIKANHEQMKEADSELIEIVKQSQSKIIAQAIQTLKAMKEAEELFKTALNEIRIDIKNEIKKSYQDSLTLNYIKDIIVFILLFFIFLYCINWTFAIIPFLNSPPTISNEMIKGIIGTAIIFIAIIIFIKIFTRKPKEKYWN